MGKLLASAISYGWPTYFLQRILRSLTSEGSAKYNSKQLAELKKHGITKNLNISFPTCLEYENIDDAINKGKVDIRTSYRIDIGDDIIRSLDGFDAPNKFLERFYRSEANKVVNWPTLLSSTVQVKHRSAAELKRLKVSKADEFYKAIVDELLAFTPYNVVSDILKKIDAEHYLPVFEDFSTRYFDEQEVIQAFENVLKMLQDYQETLVQKNIGPLVFYIGSTGLLPDDFDGAKLTAKELKQKYAHLEISAKEQDGSFFVLPDDGILSIYPEEIKFSIE